MVETADRRYPDHWRTAVYRSDLGVLLMRQERYEGAEAALTTALDRLTTLFASDDYRVRQVREALAELGDGG